MNLSIHQKKREILGLGFIFFILLIPGWAKYIQRTDKEILKYLIGTFNSQLPGSRFKTDLEKSTVKHLGNGRYEITLKDSTFTSDLHGVALFIQKKFKLKNDTSMNPGIQYLENSVRIKELTFIYEPNDNNIQLNFMKEMFLEHIPSKSEIKKKVWPFVGNPKKIRISIGEVNFKSFEINDLKKPSNNKSQKLTTTTRPGTDDSEMKHLKIEVFGIDKRNKNTLLTFDIGKIGKVTEGNEDPSIKKYLLTPGTPIPNYKVSLQKGLAFSHFSVELGKITILKKQNGHIVFNCTIENGSYSQYIGPNKTRSSFEMGYGLELKNVKLSIPPKKEWEALGNLKEFKLNFSVDNLSPEVVRIFVDICKESFEDRNMVNNMNKQGMSFQLIQFLSEIMKSKTAVKFSVSPFKHYFGELALNAEIRLQNLFSAETKIILKLFQIDDIQNRLKSSKLFSYKTLKEILNFLTQYTVKEKNGNATMTAEIKSNRPGIILLNGIPRIMMKPSANSGTK